jgi:tetratricopeptide (TPR) repeat protein
MNSTAPFQIAMLVGGIVLLLLAVGLLIFCTIKNRSTKPGFALVPLAILMIGFPAIRSFEGLGFKVETILRQVEANARALEQNPDDANAKKGLESALAQLEQKVSPDQASPKVAEKVAEGHLALGNSDPAIKWADALLAKNPQSQNAKVLRERARISKALPKDVSKPLSTATRSNLAAAANDLGKHAHLDAAARVTLAKAQAALGQTNAASTNLQQALKLEPKLLVDPKLLNLLKPGAS